MDWKEKLDSQLKGSVLVENPYANQLVKSFISTEIIEKLIEDIPNNVWMTDGSTTVQESLRDKWLWISPKKENPGTMPRPSYLRLTYALPVTRE